MDNLIILYSYHHRNTEKVAKVFAKILGAEIKNPQEVNPNEILNYTSLGFGSGIYSGKHHDLLLDLADKIPKGSGKKVYLFSTDGAPRFFTKHEPSLEFKQTKKNHTSLRKSLESKGYNIIGEFNCAGYNTNSFIKYFGGINKGRPNDEDLQNAEKFALRIKDYI